MTCVPIDLTLASMWNLKRTSAQPITHDTGRHRAQGALSVTVLLQVKEAALISVLQARHDNVVHRHGNIRPPSSLDHMPSVNGHG